ncbi:MAG: MFS transporter [Candidatus Gracilibacteria bacterium]|jgi:MFS family permease
MGKSILLKIRESSSPIWIIFEINFFRNLAAAVLTAILPLYFRKFVDSDAAVAMIFFVGYFAAFVSNIYSARIIEHLKKRKSLILALALFTLTFVLYTTVKHTAAIFFVFALYQFILSLFIMDVSLYIKHYSNYKTIAENAGKLGSFSNIGWLVGPLLGGLIADKFGFEAVFYLSSAICTVALFVFFFIRLSHEEIHIPHSRPFAANIKRFFKDPNLRKTYLNNMGIGFIFSIWDFLPLLMMKLGATITIIGLTKTLMGVPQAIFEYPLGQVADKETGEKKLFIIGYSLMALFTILLGFTTNLRVFIIFFFIAAIGSSFIEMTRDSYFFRQMPEKEVELISVYRTSDTLPYIIGQALAITIITILPIEWWFIIGGAMSFLFVINAFKLKDFFKKPIRN